MKDTKYTTYKTSLGLYKIGYTDKSIVCVKQISKATQDCTDLHSTLTNLAFKQLEEYFAGKRQVFDLPLDMQGTDFQKKVWQSLCDIPYGETRSYKQIAEQIGSPKACRAIGNANNANPISVIVPCHRVIGANGKLVGYAGGLDLKQELLNIEKQNYNM